MNMIIKTLLQGQPLVKNIVVNKPPSKTSTVRISKSKLIEIIKASNGKFMSIKFLKQDGSGRFMNCKLKFIDNLGYIHVHETKSRSHKKINTRTIKEAKLNSIHYTT